MVEILLGNSKYQVNIQHGKGCRLLLTNLEHFFASLIKPSFPFLLYFLSLVLSRAFYRFGPGISKN